MVKQRWLYCRDCRKWQGFVTLARFVEWKSVRYWYACPTCEYLVVRDYERNTAVYNRSKCA